jgi:hypothetical protein
MTSAISRTNRTATAIRDGSIKRQSPCQLLVPKWIKATFMLRRSNNPDTMGLHHGVEVGPALSRQMHQ